MRFVILLFVLFLLNLSGTAGTRNRFIRFMSVSSANQIFMSSACLCCLISLVTVPSSEVCEPQSYYTFTSITTASKSPVTVQATLPTTKVPPLKSSGFFQRCLLGSFLLGPRSSQGMLIPASSRFQQQQQDKMAEPPDDESEEVKPILIFM